MKKHSQNVVTWKRIEKSRDEKRRDKRRRKENGGTITGIIWKHKRR